jgi:AcrR family transcriptional regulator
MLVDGRVAPIGDGTGGADRSGGPTLETRILDATLVCVGRWGVAKTTLDDIAGEAGCSRATVYRLVAGGKDGLMLAAAERELARFFGHLAVRLAAEPTLAGRLAVGIAESVRVVRGHVALQYLIEHEPEVALPFISFDALDPLLASAAAFGVVTLGPFLDEAEAREVGEWVARIVLSYGFEPDDHLDLTDVAVASRFVNRYLPHLTPTGSPDPTPTTLRRTEKELVHVQH